MNSGFPAIEVLYEATGNRPLTIFLVVWLIIIYACKSSSRSRLKLQADRTTLSLHATSIRRLRSPCLGLCA
jgi:hypothetical protein